MNKNHEHKFIPLNDHVIYCPACGEMKAAPKHEHGQHVCPPCYRPHYDWTWTTTPYQPITIWGTSTTAIVTNETPLSDNDYTLT